MTPDEIVSRQEAYERILTFGLLAIRNIAAPRKNAALCGIEADHLHNIPSLFNETNEHRHIYYAGVERKSYLERVGACADQVYRDWTVERYQEPWSVLLKFALRAQEAINRELEEEARNRPSGGTLANEPPSGP